MRWLNPLLANRCARLEDRARYCHRYGLALRRLAAREEALAGEPTPLSRTFREAAHLHYRRRDAFLAEWRALTPKGARRVRA